MHLPPLHRLRLPRPPPQPSAPLRPSLPPGRTTALLRQPALLCGLFALNEVLRSLNADTLVRQELDAIADELASAEAAMQEDGDAVDTLPDGRGHYHVTTLTRAAKLYGNLVAKPVDIDFRHNPSAVAFLLGSGDHWQAVIRRYKDHSHTFTSHPADAAFTWFLRDEWTSTPVKDIVRFIRSRSSRGMAMLLALDDGSGGLDDDATVPSPTPSRQRTASASSRRSVGKRPRGTDAPTPATLAPAAPASVLPAPYRPLPDDDDRHNPKRPRPAGSERTEWRPYQHGPHTQMLHDARRGIYKCLHCSYINANPQGVAAHLRRYCPYCLKAEPTSLSTQRLLTSLASADDVPDGPSPTPTPTYTLSQLPAPPTIDIDHPTSSSSQIDVDLADPPSAASEDGDVDAPQ